MQYPLEELRSFLRERADRSLYFFCKAVLGFKDMIPTVHGEMAKYAGSDKQHQLIVEPRGHLKTSICTIGKAVWKACKNPDRRILLAANTATNASKFIRFIKLNIESNDMLRWLYPEAIPDFNVVKWTDNEITLNRKNIYPESTIEGIGVGGTVTSRHYDELIEDDLLAPEDGVTVTAEMVKKTIDWHKYATSLLVRPATDPQTVVGTRWLYDDFIAYLFTSEKWFLPALYKSVIGLDSKPRWPERFNQEAIDRILEQQGPRIFSCQYMNDPVHEDARSFDTAWFRFYTKWPPVNDRNEVQAFKAVTAIDPAISQKKHGDFSAIVTLASDAKRNRYVLDARRGRWGVDELIDQVFEVYRTYKPARVGLETVMFQKALLWPFREAMRRESVILPIVELRPSSRVTKEGRIQALHEYFSNGSLWLNQGHKELLEELRAWPAVTHDDLVDALAYAIQMLVYPDSAAEEQRWNPFSFEAIRKQLALQRSGTGPWIWHNDKPAPVYGGASIPQTPEEIMEYLHSARQ
jgi:predicted phage terminase large subunit-like protein